MMRRPGSIVRMALAAGLLAGCSDILTSRDGELGTFDGTWDGATWRGSAYAVLQGDSLTVVGHRPDPRFFYDEYVQVRVRFDGPGSYPVPESDGMLSKIDGGDAGWMPYARGTLLVTAYDAGAGAVSGYVTLRASSFDPVWQASGNFTAPVYARFTDVPQEPRRR
jgi:hypothetical protein